jgi:ABC-type nitrate/sulfonate/bicarbonate transport system substrate-binding protein
MKEDKEVYKEAYKSMDMQESKIITGIDEISGKKDVKANNGPGNIIQTSKARRFKCLITLPAAAAIIILCMLAATSASCKPVTATAAGNPVDAAATSGSAAETPEAEKITVVLDWVPNTNHTGIYTAKSLGYYKEENLTVDIIQPSEGGSADLIAAGKGEFGISYQEQVTYARTAAEPLPVVAIAAIIQHNTSGFASPADRDIKNPKDFEGRIYGGWGSPMEDAMLKGVMQKFGADFTKVEIVNIGASDFLTSVSKDVDFAWIFYGWDGIAAKLKNVPLNFMLLQDLDSRLDFYTPVIIASESTISKKPELVKRFLKATQKGYDYAIKNPDEAAEILIKEVPGLDRNLIIASQEYLSGQYLSDSAQWGYMKPEIWDTFSGWMFENNLITKKLDVEKSFTNVFLP